MLNSFSMIITTVLKLYETQSYENDTSLTNTTQ